VGNKFSFNAAAPHRYANLFGGAKTRDKRRAMDTSDGSMNQSVSQLKISTDAASSSSALMVSRAGEVLCPLLRVEATFEWPTDTADRVTSLSLRKHVTKHARLSSTSHSRITKSLATRAPVD
jgi:hypothetical protein